MDLYERRKAAVPQIVEEFLAALRLPPLEEFGQAEIGTFGTMDRFYVNTTHDDRGTCTFGVRFKGERASISATLNWAPTDDLEGLFAELEATILAVMAPRSLAVRREAWVPELEGERLFAREVPTRREYVGPIPEEAQWVVTTIYDPEHPETCAKITLSRQLQSLSIGVSEDFGFPPKK
jgi:hypothetical protein